MKALTLQRPEMAARAKPRPRLLGKGWQHAVYDMGDGRVFKRPRHTLPLLVSVFRAPPGHRPLGSRNIVRETRHLRASARNTIRLLAEQMPRLDPAMLAQPELHADGSYGQDRVTVLDDYVTRHDLEQNKRAIDAFIGLQLACWDDGFGDPGFDFLINSGIDRQGRAVQIDLGEISFDFDVMARAVEAKRWLIQDSYRDRLTDPALKAYFRTQMDSRLTPQALAARWGRGRAR